MIFNSPGSNRIVGRRGFAFLLIFPILLVLSVIAFFIWDDARTQRDFQQFWKRVFDNTAWVDSARPLYYLAHVENGPLNKLARINLNGSDAEDIFVPERHILSFRTSPDETYFLVEMLQKLVLVKIQDRSSDTIYSIEDGEGMIFITEWSPNSRRIFFHAATWKWNQETKHESDHNYTYLVYDIPSKQTYKLDTPTLVANGIEPTFLWNLSSDAVYCIQKTHIETGHGRYIRLEAQLLNMNGTAPTDLAPFETDKMKLSPSELEEHGIFVAFELPIFWDPAHPEPFPKSSQGESISFGEHGAWYYEDSSLAKHLLFKQPLSGKTGPLLSGTQWVPEGRYLLAEAFGYLVVIDTRLGKIGKLTNSNGHGVGVPYEGAVFFPHLAGSIEGK